MINMNMTLVKIIQNTVISMTCLRARGSWAVGVVVVGLGWVVREEGEEGIECGSGVGWGRKGEW